MALNLIALMYLCPLLKSTYMSGCGYIFALASAISSLVCCRCKM